MPLLLRCRLNIASSIARTWSAADTSLLAIFHANLRQIKIKRRHAKNEWVIAICVHERVLCMTEIAWTHKKKRAKQIDRNEKENQNFKMNGTEFWRQRQARMKWNLADVQLFIRYSLLSRVETNCCSLIRYQCMRNEYLSARFATVCPTFCWNKRKNCVCNANAIDCVSCHKHSQLRICICLR